ncbi:alpha/beta fold hydrolase [Streptomyces sp. VRA16 Mangrove soil]|uniref:alpha/beta fold hydrolase n=1 Tax=Streptomyces sp. VRA16 Mangrove soil TaxID=2817434 RepID=UPI001A9E2360|nr:alpha/beta fold hydrolase [Streptomyces sp. VRA16 Mangrove soil]MBO1334184.1 alpha/beta fold hydrolase [Streptomyces sp. VRA16 Mangrove soil]
MPYATVNDTTLHYEDLGSGRPLVLLHGWGTSGRVWDAQVAGLSADHRVITLDWRGCGRSDRPAGGYTIAQLASDVLEFIDVLDLDRPVLVGSSIAGAFVIEAALRAPGRIGAVVPVGSGVQHFSTRPGAKRAAAGLLADLRADRAGTLAGFVPHWYAPGTSRALIDWTVRQVLDATPRIDALATDQAAYDPRDRLPALRVPVHFLHGALDTEVPLSVPRGLLDLIPGARLTVIEGAGHMAQQERPERFNQALRAALN